MLFRWLDNGYINIFVLPTKGIGNGNACCAATDN
jgi:hypothetical protein